MEAHLDITMPEPERLPAPSFRLPDNSVATIRSFGMNGILEGVRTLPSGRTVRFSVTRQNWDKIQKTRLPED